METKLVNQAGVSLFYFSSGAKYGAESKIQSHSPVHIMSY